VETKRIVLLSGDHVGVMTRVAIRRPAALTRIGLRRDLAGRAAAAITQIWLQAAPVALERDPLAVRRRRRVGVGDLRIL
jgi:hypothetical protein